MLQQTQVDRVIPKYKEFLKAFPTVHHLARSHLAAVLRVWSGLGYNRRAKYLRDTAKMIVAKYNGRVPQDYGSLRMLPGVGDYTARAVRVFAFNEPDVLVETNIRCTVTHHFFPNARNVTDETVFQKCKELAFLDEPRQWHWALMDYGAHLKRSGVRNNHRSAHYVKQSKFEGSLRQARGEILRMLFGRNLDLRNPNIQKFEKSLASLARDGLVVSQKGKWRIA
jgi:A/G-specific adenine glycosylase